MSEATGLAVKKVARYLQLLRAAPLIRGMMGTGVMVEVKDDEGAVHHEERNLELFAALEFDRLQAALSGREPSVADRKTRETIECALRVDKAISALEGPKKARGRPRVPFKWNERRLVVDVDLLDGLDASQRRQLRKVMESIIRRL